MLSSVLFRQGVYNNEDTLPETHIVLFGTHHFRNGVIQTGLREFLAEYLHCCKLPTGKVLKITYRDSVLLHPENCQPIDLALNYPYEPCNHKEFDIRGLLHAAKSILILCNDTDEVLLALSKKSEIGAEKLWVSYGMCTTFCYIPIHTLAERMPANRIKDLMALHSFTGCDTTSYFLGVGKRTIYNNWSNHPELTTVLSNITSLPDKDTSDIPT